LKNKWLDWHPLSFSIDAHLVRLPTPFPGNSVAQAFGKPARGTIFQSLNQKSKYPLHPHPHFSKDSAKNLNQKNLNFKKIQAPLSYIGNMKTKKPTSKKCSICGIKKPLSRFNKNPRTEDKVVNKCRLCVGTPAQPKPPKSPKPLKKIKSLTSKKCSCCKEEKPLSSFYPKKKSKPEDLNCYCKFCLYSKRTNYTEYSSGKNEDPASHPKRSGFIRQQIAIQTLAASKMRNPKMNHYSVRIGCTAEAFRDYIESKFQEGMSWSNYGGKNGWVLDHIKPLCRFDLSTDEEINKASHYSNVQPLWPYQNSAKRDYYTPGHPMGWSGFDVLLERQAYLTPISVT